MRLPTWLVIAHLALALSAAGCSNAKNQAGQKPTHLKAATDVFWALQEDGYIVSKEKPHPSSQGCKPFEYLAKKGDALFHISVFECADSEQAKAIVEHPKNRHVDALLRNHDEGGMVRRGRLQLIVRRATGNAEAANVLMKKIQSW